MSASPLFQLYSAGVGLTAFAMPWWLRQRIARGKELPDRWRERFGEASAERPEGPLIWVHAASVGETNSILTMLDHFAVKGASVLLTTGTVTSETVVRGKLPKGALHQFAPLDHAPWITRFLNHWRPDLALRVESEIWPHTLAILSKREIPIIQINARMSAKASRGWKLVPGMAHGVFGCLDLVAAQSEDDRARFARFGSKQTAVSGNLKLAIPSLSFDADQLGLLRTQLGDRKTWLAASIHPGEDRIVASAQAELKARHPGVLAVVAPRHAERGGNMAERMQAMGLNVARRSLGQEITPATDIYMADTMGELGLLYRLCPVAFMGKSFTVGGGQNPAEPAQIGCALIWGPDMSNFTDLAAALETKGAAIRLLDPSVLPHAIEGLLAEASRVTRMAEAGRAYVAENTGALDKTLELLAPYLDRLNIR